MLTWEVWYLLDWGLLPCAYQQLLPAAALYPLPTNIIVLCRSNLFLVPCKLMNHSDLIPRHYLFAHSSPDVFTMTVTNTALYHRKKGPCLQERDLNTHFGEAAEAILTSDSGFAEGSV